MVSSQILRKKTTLLIILKKQPPITVEIHYGKSLLLKKQCSKIYLEYITYMCPKAMPLCDIGYMKCSVHSAHVDYVLLLSLNRGRQEALHMPSSRRANAEPSGQTVRLNGERAKET